MRNDKIIIKINKSDCLEIATYQNSGLFIQMRMDHLIGETVLGKAYIKGTSDEDVICFVKDIAKCAEKRDPELLRHALSNSGWEWFSVIPRAKIITRKVLPDGGTERGRETLNETISRIKKEKKQIKEKKFCLY